MDPISGKKNPAGPSEPIKPDASSSDDEEEFLDAVEQQERLPRTGETNQSDKTSQALEAPKAKPAAKVPSRLLMPPVLGGEAEKKSYRKYTDEEVLRQIDRVGLTDLIKQPSNDLEFLSAERLLQEMAVLDKPRPASVDGEAVQLSTVTNSEITPLLKMSVAATTHIADRNVADAWKGYGLEEIIPFSEVQNKPLAARDLIDDIDRFEEAARTRNAASRLFFAKPGINTGTGVFPAEFQPGKASHTQLRKGEEKDVGGLRIYTMWRDHAGILRTVVPATGTDAGKAISKIKAGKQGAVRQVFRAFSLNRTVKFPFTSVRSTAPDGTVHRHIGAAYNAHFAPLRSETYEALIDYMEKRYDTFVDAVLQHDAIMNDVLDTFRDGPFFSETMIKSVLSKAATQHHKRPADGFDAYRRASKAFCHYVRNISVRRNKTAFHLAHGQWENMPVYTNPAYAEMVDAKNARHGLQRTIDSILFDTSLGSLVGNIHGASIRAAIVASGMLHCAEMTDFENRHHMDNVAQTIGTICSLISGALSAAPLVAAGGVANGILDPLQKAIIGHKASRFVEGAMTKAILTEIHASLLSPANSGVRVPGLMDEKAGGSNLSASERSRIGQFFVSRYKDLIDGIL